MYLLNEKNAILFVEIYKKNSVFRMDLSTSDELELFSKELHRYMSPDALEQLARKVGFVKRKSKYHAQDLVALCIWFSQNIAHLYIFGRIIFHSYSVHNP
ncbi:hypothetical protein Bmyc01_55720 [Bacillus mycoides]|nr:hypothetical protein Bmyc01_55720 [Bacillus mycoides]